jgi:hypothetical protein
MHDVLLGWLTFLTGLAQAPYILQGIHPVKHQGVDIEWLAVAIHGPTRARKFDFRMVDENRRVR